MCREYGLEQPRQQRSPSAFKEKCPRCAQKRNRSAHTENWPGAHSLFLPLLLKQVTPGTEAEAGTEGMHHRSETHHNLPGAWSTSIPAVYSCTDLPSKYSSKAFWEEVASLLCATAY